MEYVLQTNMLQKKYGKSTVLKGVTMHVPKGAIYGFIGQNGAGKTTVIRLICGLQEPTGGDYSLYGISHKQKEIVKARRRMSAVVETPAVYLDMTAEENLKMQYKILGIPSLEGIPELLKLVELEQTNHKKAKHFSLGMKQRLGIAIALVGNPDFLVLDEPINGLDPQGIIEIRELILKLNKEQGMTILISSHMLDELSRIATYYGFMDKGQIVKEISASDLEVNFRKSYRLVVTDTKALSCVLDQMGVDYRILSEKEAAVFSEIVVSKLVFALAKYPCEVLSIYEQNESLESYYINLMGGAQDE